MRDFKSEEQWIETNFPGNELLIICSKVKSVNFMLFSSIKINRLQIVSYSDVDDNIMNDGR